MRERVARVSARARAMRARVVRHPRLTVLALFGLVVLMTALALRHVGHRRQVVELAYELGDATSELRKLDEEARRLRLEKSVLTSPARIERLALVLGMVRPTTEQVRVVWSSPVAQRDQEGTPPGFLRTLPNQAFGRPFAGGTAR